MDHSRRLCDALAKKGNGLGMCNRPLDEHGNCDRASDHIEDSVAARMGIEPRAKEKK